MEYFSAYFLLIASSSIAFSRIWKTGSKDAFSPISVWYAFLVVFLFIRLAVLLSLDLEYRWLPGVEHATLAIPIIKLLLLALAASAAFEFGAMIVGKRKPANVRRVKYSIALALVPFVIGVSFLIIYYMLLGGFSAVLSSMAQSKSVSGGGGIIMVANIAWLGPLLLLAGQPKRLGWLRSGLSVLMLLLLFALFLMYGRVTPLMWGALVFFAGYHFLVRRISLRTLITFSLPTVIVLVLFKSFRLALSREIESDSIFDVLAIYSLNYLVEGGEHSIVDMSIRLLLLGAGDFPLGSFLMRWIVWPIDILPSVLFPVFHDYPTVGRQLYWWATGNIHLESGIPVFGFVTAFKSATILFVFFVHVILGMFTMFSYRLAQTGRPGAVLLYCITIAHMVIFSRIGDFSAALVQVIVFGAGGLVFLEFIGVLQWRSRTGPGNLDKPVSGESATF